MHGVPGPAARLPGSVFFRRLKRLIAKNSLKVIVLSLVSLTLLNLLVSSGTLVVRGSMTGAVAVGGLIAGFTLLLVYGVYVEYRKRFSRRGREMEDIICVDCSLFAGKTLLCTGCRKNPYEKRGERFDLLDELNGQDA